MTPLTTLRLVLQAKTDTHISHNFAFDPLLDCNEKSEKCIMEEILQLNPSNNSPIQINSCRIYLKVFHLCDMIDPNEK